MYSSVVWRQTVAGNWGCSFDSNKYDMITPHDVRPILFILVDFLVVLHILFFYLFLFLFLLTVSVILLVSP